MKWKHGAILCFAFRKVHLSLDHLILFFEYNILILSYFRTKNWCLDNLVKKVRQAFEGSELVKVDCRGLGASDNEKIGAKLMVHIQSHLVPSCLVSFYCHILF